MYLLSEDAWTYELTGSSHTSSAVAMLALVIPDATPDGERSPGIRLAPMDTPPEAVGASTSRMAQLTLRAHNDPTDR